MRVEEHTIATEYGPVHYRSAPAATDATPLYLHDVPTSSEDWTAFLERTGGLAVDLIGFGQSSKAGHLDYSPESLARFVERFLGELGIDRVQAVGHGWGGVVALLLDREVVDRLVLIDAAPRDPAAWPRWARLLRRRLVGELLMGATTRAVLKRTLRRACTRPDAWSDDRLDTVWDQFDQGTQRAILRLLRSAASEPRGELRVPGLIVWGEEDPWFGFGGGDDYTVERIPGAGHWPWLDEPRVIERVAEFLVGE